MSSSYVDEDDVPFDYDDLPPPPEWEDDFGTAHMPPDRSGSTRRSRRHVPREGSMAEEVWATAKKVLRTVDGQSAEELTSFINQVRISKTVLAELDVDRRRVLASVLEAIEFEISNSTSDSTILFEGCMLAKNFDPAVETFFAELETVDPLPPSVQPLSAWMAVANEVQARSARKKAIGLVEAIDSRSPIAEQIEAFELLVETPPATRVAVIRENGMNTVAQMLASMEAAGVTTGYRFSSGYPTLDATQTAAGEELGCIAQGEMMLVLGATGTGKSSFNYAIMVAMTLDQLRRHPDSYSVLFHTEELSYSKAKAMGLVRGDRWHFLAKNIIIENIGSSRKRMAEVFFESVAYAARMSEKTGRPIVEFVIHHMQIDYVQAIKEAGESDFNAVNTTSELILRGFQECNPAEIEKFSGVNFTRYTGMKWPDGLEHHKVAVIAYGQLRKASGDSVEYYDPKDKKHTIPTFTLEDTSDNPGWVHPDGSKWCWDVRTGDFRLFTKNEIYGSAKPLQNATSVLLLHRSRPQKNPVAYVDEHGFKHLLDQRARLIPDKARNGQQALYVPMSFDVMTNGFRAQYYDTLAEQLVREGKIEVDEEYFQLPGDPMLPKRPKRSMFAHLRY
jgi:hypothetical protein